MSKSESNRAVEEILADYYTAVLSREASLMGRKEVLSGKAKFGIFGDGKELAQLALARAFKPGDWRSGYYRDQTLLMALGLLSPEQFFAQLYADPDPEREPHSHGRQMNAHFATRLMDDEGAWLPLKDLNNSSADASPTALQMGRLVGLAYASKYYRAVPEADSKGLFSNNGEEVVFATIGNASCAEGIFWESVNACGVLQVPAVISIWDDDYGISVPNKYQLTKGDLSQCISGFADHEGLRGLKTLRVQGHNYSELIKTYAGAANLARKEHQPVVIHVVELTQPQGHSTSGSQERYKNAERLKYEGDRDCLKVFKAWIESEKIATRATLEELELKAKATVLAAKNSAFAATQEPFAQALKGLLNLNEDPSVEEILSPLLAQIAEQREQSLRGLLSLSRRHLWSLNGRGQTQPPAFEAWLKNLMDQQISTYRTKLYRDLKGSALRVPQVDAQYGVEPPRVDGRQMIQAFFDAKLKEDPRIFIIGEDVGVLGGVNLEFDQLQARHGDMRVTDTGIREATIAGQGFGASLRGLKPIADIQYLDYVLYAFELLSDDVASLHYRTGGRQSAPLIVRTKGHRLEGIWHTGSPMGTLVNGLRGMHLCVPRNMLQACGFYNTLLKAEEPALVIEVLNAYRLKEAKPENLADFTLPLGVPEILKTGQDLSLVTYGALVPIALEAAQILEPLGVSVEVIDVQTLLPFDRPEIIKSSLDKTHALLVVDEDVPGGASAYILREVLESQKAFFSLDCEPRTLCAAEHRGPYGSEGDYVSKPQIEDIVEIVLEMMRERVG